MNLLKLSCIINLLVYIVIILLTYLDRKNRKEFETAYIGLFHDYERVSQKVKKLNAKLPTININKIKITDDFKNSNTSKKKIARKQEYFNKHKEFDSVICVNKNYVLIDGYITYLIAKNNNFKQVKVVIK